MGEGDGEDVIIPSHSNNLTGGKGESGNRLPFLRGTMKRILICVFVLLLFGAAFAEEKRIEVPVGDSPAVGPEDAPVTIIEFIDFQ